MTEHLPIQRWTKIFTRYPASEVLPNENGEYVTYADHVAVLRACEARVREDERSSNFTPDDHLNGMTEAYQRGLDAAREAVEVLLKEWWERFEGTPDDLKELKGMVELNRAIAAIDALKEER